MARTSLAPAIPLSLIRDTYDLLIQDIEGVISHAEHDHERLGHRDDSHARARSEAAATEIKLGHTIRDLICLLRRQT